jgi:hypothetical protein
MELVNYNAVPSRKNKSRSPLVGERLLNRLALVVSNLVRLQPVITRADFHFQRYAVG